MIKPKKLVSGDTVAAVSTSWGGPSVIPYRYEIGKKQFEETFGLRVVEMNHTLKPAKWVRENPKARAEDLMAAFLDPSIKAIISTIGGEESIRILPYLDFEVIRQNPKIVLGYSDTTITHLACFKAGIVSFYGPSFMAGFAENKGIFPYLANSIRKTLFESGTIGEIKPNAEGWTVEHLSWQDPANQSKKRKLNPPALWKLLQGEGIAQGHLLGGCAEVLEFAKGTSLWPTLDQWKGAIFFLETSEEAPSPMLVERWLRNYGSQGILQSLAGMIVGRPGGNVSERDFDAYDEVITKVVSEELGLTTLPIMTRMDFGHTDPIFTIPYGIRAQINCEAKTFSILEKAVSE